MKFYSRRAIKPENLNSADVLFGGELLKWIDEEAGIYAACQMQSLRIVTKAISDIEFLRPAKQGDIIEFGFDVVKRGYTSLTVCSEVRNKTSKEGIVRIKKIVFVHLDENNKPAPYPQKIELCDFS